MFVTARPSVKVGPHRAVLLPSLNEACLFSWLIRQRETDDRCSVTVTVTLAPPETVPGSARGPGPPATLRPGPGAGRPAPPPAPAAATESRSPDPEARPPRQCLSWQHDAAGQLPSLAAACATPAEAARPGTIIVGRCRAALRRGGGVGLLSHSDTVTPPGVQIWRRKFKQYRGRVIPGRLPGS